MDAITDMILEMGGDEKSPEEKEWQRKAVIMQAEKECRIRYIKKTFKAILLNLFSLHFKLILLLFYCIFRTIL